MKVRIYMNMPDVNVTYPATIDVGEYRFVLHPSNIVEVLQRAVAVSRDGEKYIYIPLPIVGSWKWRNPPSTIEVVLDGRRKPLIEALRTLAKSPERVSSVEVI
jgi:hypothetical protein